MKKIYNTHTRARTVLFAVLAILTIISPSTVAGVQTSRRGDAKLRNEKRRPPNIVLIFADDLGYGDLGSYGNDQIKTPHLDRLAAEGVRLTNFYAVASVCTPSRAGLLTGRYPVRSGLMRVLFPQSTTGIDAAEITLAEALRARGYRTAAIGKWHLGHLPPFLPTSHGFDRYFGIPYSNDMQPTPLLRDTQIIEEPARQETLTRRYTQAAIDFMRESTRENRPFFVYLPHTFPHIPLYASERFRGKSAGGSYGDAVEEMDWSTGEIMRALKESGADDNTLVIFTSDNGPWLAKRPDAGSAGALRDGKTTVYEGGIRVPFIARLPSRLPRARTLDSPAIMLDLFPTIVRLAGGAPDRLRPTDGRDIMPMLRGGRANSARTFYFYQNETLRAVRSGDWKLHLPRRVKDAMLPAELYDLEQDVGEAKNVAAAHAGTVARLTRQAEEFDAEARRTATSPKR